MVKVKKTIESMLRQHPKMFAFASKCYHRMNGSFRTLSPGAPDAIKQAFAEIKKTTRNTPGDYYEFGLFRGYTFLSAQKTCSELGIENIHFYGFDSFQGLPPVTGVDKKNNQFFEGQFKCAKDEVVANLTNNGVDWSKTTLIEGFFSDSLTEESKRSHEFRPVDVALIDCDLYSSTREVLAWLEDFVRDGSILLFDDWYSYGEDESLGQQRAFSEFLGRNDNYMAEPFIEFKEHGKGFILNIAG